MKRLLLTSIIGILLTMLSTTCLLLQAMEKERGENLERDYDAIAVLNVNSSRDYYFNTNLKPTEGKCGFAGGANLRRKNDAPIHIDFFNCLFDGKRDLKLGSFEMVFDDGEIKNIKEMSLQLLRNSVGKVEFIRMWLTDTNGLQYSGISEYDGPEITQEFYDADIEMKLHGLLFEVTVKQGNGKGKGSSGDSIIGFIELNSLRLCEPGSC